MNRSLLAVFAHPDDETSVGPLLAASARRGATLTSSRSRPASGAPSIPISRLGSAWAPRANRNCAAALELGIHEPVFGGFEDQGIEAPEAIDRVAACLREIIARLRPDVIVTFGPDGLTGHPDHRAASYIATQVFQQQGLLLHRPRKLYYVAFPESLGAALPPPYDARLRTTTDAFVTTEVDCREGLDAAQAAIRCHRTQWSPERMSQFDHINRHIFGGKVFLRLAISAAEPPRGSRETDLFAGL